MTKMFGRFRSVSAFVVTGNKNGLIGIGLAKSPDNKSALKRAKNRAGQQLMYVERYDDHTGKILLYYNIGLEQ